MNLALVSNCPSSPAILMLTTIMALKATEGAAGDIATISGVLLTAPYTQEDEIAEITTLISTAENVTIEANQARIDVAESTSVTKLGLNTSGALHIL